MTVKVEGESSNSEVKVEGDNDNDKVEGGVEDDIDIYLLNTHININTYILTLVLRFSLVLNDSIILLLDPSVLVAVTR